MVDVLVKKRGKRKVGQFSSWLKETQWKSESNLGIDEKQTSPRSEDEDALGHVNLGD